MLLHGITMELKTVDPFYRSCYCRTLVVLYFNFTYLALNLNLASVSSFDPWHLLDYLPKSKAHSDFFFSSSHQELLHQPFSMSSSSQTPLLQGAVKCTVLICINY